MTAEAIAEKYVYGRHDALTDNQEVLDMAKDINNLVKIKCQELLEIVAEKAKTTTIWEGNTGSEYVDYDVDRDSILNVVDLDNFCS